MSGLRDLLAIPRQQIASYVRQWGVLLFRGFTGDSHDFTDLTDHVTPQHMTHTFRRVRESRRADDTVFSVVIGNGRLCLHGEMYYLPRRPDVLWLMCITPPETDGETTICSGAALLDALSPATRASFERRRVRYVQRRDPEDWRTSFGVATFEQLQATLREDWGIESAIELDDNGWASFDFVTHALRKSKSGNLFINSIANYRQYLPPEQLTWDDGAPIHQETVDEIDRAGERVSERIVWQKGDVVALDNSWILHGRRPFVGPRDIITRFGILT